MHEKKCMPAIEKKLSKLTFYLRKSFNFKAEYLNYLIRVENLSLYIEANIKRF